MDSFLHEETPPYARKLLEAMQFDQPKKELNTFQDIHHQDGKVVLDLNLDENGSPN